MDRGRPRREEEEKSMRSYALSAFFRLTNIATLSLFEMSPTVSLSRDSFHTRSSREDLTLSLLSPTTPEHIRDRAGCSST